MADKPSHETTLQLAASLQSHALGMASILHHLGAHPVHRDQALEMFTLGNAIAQETLGLLKAEQGGEAPVDDG